MDWLLSAVARYGKQNLVSKPSLGVCKLAAAFPSLGFFDDAVRQLMMRPPSAEDFIDLLELTDPEQRVVMLRETAEQTSVLQRTAYLDSLPASRAQLSRQQARLLVGADPELLGAPVSHWGLGFRVSPRRRQNVRLVTPSIFTSHSLSGKGGKGCHIQHAFEDARAILCLGSKEGV